MHGLILDMHWNTGGDPVTVVAVGSLAALQALDPVDPNHTAATWFRDQITHVQNVTKQSAVTGSPLPGAIYRKD